MPRDDDPPAANPAASSGKTDRDRRLSSRRRADHDAREELAFLTACLDVLSGRGAADQRLAGLLQLLADTAGARRAAVLADGGERRVAVAQLPDEAPAAAEALAAWLDARSPRSRAERAAAPPALVSLAVAERPRPHLVGGGTPGVGGSDTADRLTRALDGAGLAPRGRRTGAITEVADPGSHYACVIVDGHWSLVLGFEFGDAVSAEHCATRLPPAFARHAATALAMVAAQLATERDLGLLRAHDKERARFVSTVAHELRTPLTGLGGYLELILSGSVADPAVEREFLERSRDIVVSIDELVGDLLELSRIESGSLRLDIAPFSVAELCQHVLERVAPIALGRDIRLTSDLPPRLRAATGDRRRVEQIAINLLGNALKFTPPGGSVEIAAWLDGPVALVAVRDDGLGIPSEDRARIWERFHRVAGHERVSGTGLGLPIARELALAMGGALEVASIARIGSSFVLALPGPTPVPGEVIAATMGRALADEEQRLEENGMRRRLADLERASAARTGQLAAARESRARPARSDQAGMVDSRSATGVDSETGPDRTVPPVRLRAITGGAATWPGWRDPRSRG